MMPFFTPGQGGVNTLRAAVTAALARERRLGLRGLWHL